LKKLNTKITIKNGGVHSTRAYKKLISLLTNHDYYSARLYHLIFMGSNQKDKYLAALKQLIAKLRDGCIPCQWRGAMEVDEEKGLHFHVFILTENKYFNPCSIINHNKQDWLNVMMQKRELTFHIAARKSIMHQSGSGFRRCNYASIPKTKPEKLADCMEWISYLAKARSKDIDIGQVYYSSRPSKERLTSIAQ